MSSIFPPLDNLGEQPLVDDLAECLHQLDAIDVDVRLLLTGLNEEQIHWSQASSRWSISQCLVHLVIVGRTFLPLIDEAIEDTRADHLWSRGPFRYGFHERWFVSSTEPPPNIRLRTPAFARPPDDQPLANIVADFVAVHQELRQSLRSANGLDLARMKIRSPFMRALRLSLGLCFAFLAAHERRHLWQAWQLRRHEQFPALIHEPAT